MRDYTRLIVWKRADQVVLDVYRLTKQFPSHERFGLVSQMRRAAVSITSNIAEACGRATRPDGARQLSVASGSAFELEYQLGLATRLGYLAPATATLAKIDEVKKMLYVLTQQWRSEGVRGKR